MTWRSFIILCILYTFNTVKLGEQVECEYRLHGSSVSLDLNYPDLKEELHLTWKRNTDTIFERKKSKVRKGELSDISSNGSLQLKDLKPEHNGEYQGEVFDVKGISHKSNKHNICVIEHVPKPTVVTDCKMETLTCKVEPKSKLTFSWKLNTKSLPGETKNVMKFNPKKTKTSKYSCKVKNEFSTNESGEIEINCQGKATGTNVQEAKTLFGLDFWLMMGILAAAGSLMLLLVIVLALCLCRRKRRGKKQISDEEELRLANLTQQPDLPGQHGHQAPTRKVYAGNYGHPHSGAQPPALPKPRGQGRPKPPHPPGLAQEEDQPPPRPKPRKKGSRPPRS